MWVDIYELKRFLGEEVTQIQKETGISLFELSNEIFNDENKLLEVFDAFDTIHHLDNELARRCVHDIEL